MTVDHEVDGEARDRHVFAAVEGTHVEAPRRQALSTKASERGSRETTEQRDDRGLHQELGPERQSRRPDGHQHRELPLPLHHGHHHGVEDREETDDDQEGVHEFEAGVVGLDVAVELGHHGLPVLRDRPLRQSRAGVGEDCRDVVGVFDDHSDLGRGAFGHVEHPDEGATIHLHEVDVHGVGARLEDPPHPEEVVDELAVDVVRGQHDSPADRGVEAVSEALAHDDAAEVAVLEVLALDDPVRQW